MAFHPFKTFRKHQKALFALLILVCMFVFILQFGSGDLIQRLLGGNPQAQGDKVVTLYGKDFTRGDINQVLTSRQLANDLIDAALGEAQDKASEAVLSYKPDSSNPTDQGITTLRESFSQREDMLNNARMKLVSARDEDERQQAIQTLKLYSQILSGMIQKDYVTLRNLESSLSSDKSDAGKTKEQGQALADLRFLVRNQYRQIDPSGSRFYYGGGATDADLLDFAIWKHQAEKLGVVLTKADARRALAFEAAGHGLPADPGGAWKSDPVFKSAFARHAEATEDQAATALEDEFRVRIAQGLMGGPASGAAALDAGRNSPDPIAPYDFWTYFRDNRTTLKVAFLPLTVQSFTSQVTGAPDPRELDDLWNRYRSKVPDPSLPTPGFKQPHRMQISYLTARTDTPYYTDLLDHAQYTQVRYGLYSGLPSCTASGGVAPSLALAGLVSGDPLGGGPLAADYHEVLPARSASASLAGELVGLSSVGGVGALSGQTAAALASAEEYKQQASRMAAAALQLPLIGSASGAPFAGMAGALVPPHAADGLYTNLADTYFWQKQRKDELAQIAEADLQQFTKSLEDEIKRARDEAVKKNADDKDSRLDPDEYAHQKADEFIRQQARKNGWELNEEAGLVDRYEMAKAMEEDKKLKPLAEAVTAGQPPASFIAFLFDRMKADLDEPRGPFHDEKHSNYVIFWLSQNENEHELPSESEALNRHLLQDAWKKQQARKLALRQAEQISEGAKAKWGEYQTGSQGQQDGLMQFLTDQKLGDVFVLDGVARLVGAQTKTQTGQSYWNYTKYVIPMDKIPDGPPDLLDRMLAMDRPGQTLIFGDKPANHFYVAVLESRVVPKYLADEWDKEFAADFGANADAATAPLWQEMFLPRRESDWRKALMRQLREDAAGTAGVNEQGQLILPDKGQKQQPGQPNSPGGSEEPPEPPIGF